MYDSLYVISFYRMFLWQRLYFQESTRELESVFQEVEGWNLKQRVSQGLPESFAGASKMEGNFSGGESGLESDFLFTSGSFPSLHLLGNKNSLIMSETPGRTQ